MSGTSTTMTCEALHSRLTELAVAFLGLYINSDNSKKACQNNILSICSIFAEFEKLVRKLQNICPALDPKDATITLVTWICAIMELLTKVKEIPAVEISCAHDVHSAHKIHWPSVELVTIEVQACAKTFKDKLEELELHLDSSRTPVLHYPDQRDDLESPTNVINIAQQEYVIPPDISSTIDQGTQCNRRTQEAEIYRQELKLAKLEIEKLRLLQLEGRQAASPIEAESVVQVLIRQRKETIDNKNDELAVLSLEYHLGQIQIGLGQYQKAEITARSVYDKRKKLHVVGMSEVDLQASRRQFCKALRCQNTKPKLKEAEIMYRNVWDKDVVPPISQKGRLPCDLRYWRLENGHNLGIVLSEEERFRAAEDQHRDVLAERRELLGNAHADTTQSAREVIRSLLKQPDIVDLPSKILLLVEPIWQSSKKARETSTLVLWCGDKLGETSYGIAKFHEASTVLRDVWEARKKICTSNPSDAMSTAKLLALSLNAIGKSQEADTVGDWVWETNQAHPEAGFAITPEEFQVHVRSLFRQKKFSEAALVSKEEWNSCSKRHNESTLHESTLNACYFYGAAVSQAQQTTTRDASTAIAAVQDTWRLLPVPKLSETSALKIYYLYAYMLYSMSNDVSGAINVLLKVWTMRAAVRSAEVSQRSVMNPAFAGVLECCYLLTHICVNIGKHSKAKELVQYGLRKARKGSDIYKRFSDAKDKRKFGPTERYAPSFLWFL